MQPFHLIHYELKYHVMSVPIRMMRLVYTSLVGGEEGEFDVQGFATESMGQVYVRMWINDEGMYSVGLTYSPWPAYAVDPIRLGTWHSSRSEALSGVHRVYRRYRQEPIRPVPVMDVFDAYEFTNEALWLLDRDSAITHV